MRLMVADAQGNQVAAGRLAAACAGAASSRRQRGNLAPTRGLPLKHPTPTAVVQVSGPPARAAGSLQWWSVGEPCWRRAAVRWHAAPLLGAGMRHGQRRAGSRWPRHGASPLQSTWVASPTRSSSRWLPGVIKGALPARGRSCKFGASGGSSSRRRRRCRRSWSARCICVPSDRIARNQSALACVLRCTPPAPCLQRRHSAPLHHALHALRPRDALQEARGPHAGALLLLLSSFQAGLLLSSCSPGQG